MDYKKDLTQIRAIACMAVVILHTFRSFANQNSMSHLGYAAACCVRDLMNFAVPCFLMVTGALLLDEEREVTIRKIWRKYIPSVLVPLLFCAILFSIVDALFNGDFSVTGILKDAAVDFWTDGSWKHLWYLYMLIGIYALLPFYRKIAAHTGETEMYYLLGIWLLFLVVIPQAGIITGAKSGFYVCTYTVYPLFLFIGYACDRWYLHWRLPWAVFGVSALLMAGCSYAANGAGNETARSMIGTYAFLPVVFMAASFFQAWMAFSRTLPYKAEGFFKKVDECGFGIYLYHVLIIRLLMKVLPSVPITLPILFGISALVFFLSWGAVYLLRKVPVFRYIA